MTNQSIISSILFTIPLAFATIQAQTPAYPDFWNNPTLSAKIDQGIERNRKSDAVIHVIDAAGKPLPNVNISVEQVDSSFHFGANIFMLGGYPTPELNRRYEEMFCNLFNGATVPFYWRDLEPDQGKPRFAADSPFIERRPPTDTVVEFCEKHSLKMHGHPLVWKQDYGAPIWLRNDTINSIPLFEEHIRKIAERYGKRIQRWDVVNEVVAQKSRCIPGFPPQYERLAFTWAERYFPADSSLYINELTAGWHADRQAYIDLIQQLLNDKARISGIGLQFHFLHNKNRLINVVEGKEWVKPDELLATLDAFSQFALPIHISEITLACPENDTAGQMIQAQVARSFYRLWFSHPAVNSITWWNFPDGGAARGEKLLSGLVTSDLQPKIAYSALQDLIHREWRTNVKGSTGVDGSFALRGFHGHYKVVVESAGITRAFSIAPGDSNALTIQISSKAPNTKQ